MARGRLRATVALLCLLLVSLAQSALAASAHTISAMQREMVSFAPQEGACARRGTASRAHARPLTRRGAQERRAERSAEHASMVTRVAKRREAALARDPTARAAQLRDAAALLGALRRALAVERAPERAAADAATRAAGRAATRQQRLADVQARLDAGISAERQRVSQPRRASAG